MGRHPNGACVFDGKTAMFCKITRKEAKAMAKMRYNPHVATKYFGPYKHLYGIIRMKGKCLIRGGCMAWKGYIAAF